VELISCKIGATTTVFQAIEKVPRKLQCSYPHRLPKFGEFWLTKGGIMPLHYLLKFKIHVFVKILVLEK